MLHLALVDAARLASLASGRGGMPTGAELPFVVAFLVVLGFLGTRVLRACGLTLVESVAVAAVAPALVLVDAPLGALAPGVTLWANAAGCIVPLVVSVKVFLERRAPILEGIALALIGIVVAYLASHVVPDRGVLLQYRAPAIVVGVLGAGLLAARPGVPAGPVSFAAGTIGVVVGADLMHLGELAAAGTAGRIILGGAGILDGIFLVAILAAGVGELCAIVLRMALRVKAPAKPTA